MDPLDGIYGICSGCPAPGLLCLRGREGTWGRRRRWEEVVGVTVHSTGCACSWISSSSGTWGTSMSGLMSDWISGLISPRRVASSSSIGDVPHSPSTDCRNEASTISSPLRANRGAMHHCSSLTASQRTPVGQPDSLAQACSTLAKARVLCSLIIWKLEEAGEGMFCSSQCPGIVSGGAHHPACFMFPSPCSFVSGQR